MSPGTLADVRVELPPGFEAQLDDLFCLIELWSRRVNLVSRRLERADLLRHAISSLAVLEIPKAAPLDSNLRLLDIGSGGGFPALVLLAARPRWTAVMVEATGKKCHFLREAGERLAAGRATVLHHRFEEPLVERGPEAEASDGPFDLVTLRAVRPEKKLVASLRQRLGGRLAPGASVAWFTAKDSESQALAMDALLQIGLQDVSIIRVEWAEATLAIGSAG